MNHLDPDATPLEATKSYQNSTKIPSDGFETLKNPIHNAQPKSQPLRNDIVGTLLKSAIGNSVGGVTQVVATAVSTAVKTAISCFSKISNSEPISGKSDLPTPPRNSTTYHNCTVNINHGMQQTYNENKTLETQRYAGNVYCMDEYDEILRSIPDSVLNGTARGRINTPIKRSNYEKRSSSDQTTGRFYGNSINNPYLPLIKKRRATQQTIWTTHPAPGHGIRNTEFQRASGLTEQYDYGISDTEILNIPIPGETESRANRAAPTQSSNISKYKRTVVRNPYKKT